MKFFSKLAFAFLLLTFSSANLFADAQVQLIHNSSDPAAAVVDIYINGQKISQLDNFAYRAATPYVPIPAGVDIMITVANSSSTDVMNDVIKTFNIGKLTDNQEYIIVVNGVVGTGFNDGESGRDINLDLKVLPGKRVANMQTQIDVSLYHGVTDAGKVDIYIAKTGQQHTANPQVKDLNYGESSTFISLNAGFYNIKLTEAGNKESVIGEYNAPLTTASGSGALVMMSGFITPEDENGGVDVSTYGFGLLAVAPIGFVIPIPQLDFASIQVIHNSSDPKLEYVDLYINGLKLTEDLQYRNATAFLPVVAGQTVNISINSSTSTGISDGVFKTFQLPSLTANQEFVVVANGFLDTTGYENILPSRNIEFNLYSNSANTTQDDDSKIEINLFHGSSDAPPVDIYTDISGDALYSNLDYGMFSGVKKIDTEDYIFTLTLAGNKEIVAAKYNAPLSTPMGNTTIFVSGFINPENQNGGVDEDKYSIAVFAALANGTVIELEEVEENDELASIQVIHNSSDPKLTIVDVYFNDELFIDNFEFRSSTPYLPVMADTDYNVSINSATSTNVDDGAIDLFYIPTLEVDSEYVFILSGVIGDGFNSGADGRDIEFGLYATDGLSESLSPEIVTINAYHGSTDAPAVDVLEAESDGLIIEYLDYGNEIGWTPYDIIDTKLKITESANIENVFGVYLAELTLFKGKSLFIFTSGFLSPGDEPNGTSEQEFGLYAATSDGNTIKLDLVNSVNLELSDKSNLYPNPSSNLIEIELDGAISNSYKIYNNKSELMIANESNNTSRLSIDINQLNAGNYFVIIETNKGDVFKKFIVTK